MIKSKLYYVRYEDEDGNEESTEVIAPNEHLVHALMVPFLVLDVIEIEDETFAHNFELEEEEWDYT